jgi:hypothetical protein
VETICQMSRPRALTDEQAIAAEAWFADYERVGTFEEKAKALGITGATLRDAIRRVRGQDTKCTRHKLSAFEIERFAQQLAEGPRGPTYSGLVPRETNQTEEIDVA